MSRPADHAARLQALTDVETSILVEAGAGSGKTALMAGRIARLLANGIDPHNIAAITFTEAAAANLRNAVHRLLTRLTNGDVPVEVADAFHDAIQPDIQQRLQAARKNLDRLVSSTIHAFARNLTTPYPVEARLDPGAAMLSPEAADRMFETVRDEWLREQLREGSPKSESLLANLFLLEPNARQLIRELTDKVREQPHLEGPFGRLKQTHFRQLEKYTLAFCEAATSFASTVRSAPFPAPDKATEMANAMDDLAQVLGNAGGDIAFLGNELGTHAKDHHVFTNHGNVRLYRTKTAWKDAAASADLSKSVGEAWFERTQDLHEAAKEALEDLRPLIADMLMTGLMDSARDCIATFQRAKLEAALLDPDDLLQDAVRLLREAPEVRDELAARYRHVLVDEFQDTDPIQAEIIWRITGQPSDQPWQNWPSVPGARFIVGDPKQSIYRFRHADMKIYEELRNRMEDDPHARVLTITTNFRSRREILDLTNATFERHFQGHLQPEYQALEPHSNASDLPAVLRLPLQEESEAISPDVPAGDITEEYTDESPTGASPILGLTIGELRQLEATRVAELCAHLLETYRHADGSSLQKREIALLTPGGVGLEAYELALESRGIAISSQAGKNYYGQQITQDLIALTRSLADVHDTLALGSLLRGPLIGARDDELVEATVAARKAILDRDGDLPSTRLALRIDTPLEDLPSGAVRDALARLQPLAQSVNARTPFDTLMDAVDILEVATIVQHRNPRFARRDLANLDRFVHDAEAYAGLGLRSYAHDVWRAWHENRNEKEAASDALDDAVTLMTIHASKGLEWPVVIPINLHGKMRGSRGPVNDRRNGALHTKVLGLPTSGLEQTTENEKLEQEAENHRLGYVLTTRARDLLILPTPTGEPDNTDESTWFGHIAWPHEVGETIDPPKAAAMRTYALPDTGPDEEAFREQVRNLEVSLPTVTRRKPSDHEEDEEPARHDVDEEVARQRERSRVGFARGRIVHKLLEELITGELAEDDLPQRVATLISQTDLTTELDVEDLARKIRVTWNLSHVVDVRNQLVAELPLAHARREGNDIEITTGVADAVAVARSAEGDALLVIDWKSDKTNHHVDVYRKQLGAYLKLLDAPRGLLIFTSIDHIEVVTREP